MNKPYNPEDNAIFVGMGPSLESRHYGVAVHVVPLDLAYRPAKVTECITNQEDDRSTYREVIRGIPEKMPVLVWIDEIQEDDPAAILKWLSEGILARLPGCTKINVDCTGGWTIGHSLGEHFDGVVKTVLTPGLTGSEMQLMQETRLAFMRGYSVPPEESAPNPRIASCIAELGRQIQQLTLSPSPRYTTRFKSKDGLNHLLHAWALSLKDALNWQTMQCGYWQSVEEPVADYTDDHGMMQSRYYYGRFSGMGPGRLI